MRPKASELVQHGGPPGWLEESDPADVILYVMDRSYRLPFPYRTACPDRSCPAASWWNFQLLLYSKCTHTTGISYVTQGRHGLVLVDPCLLFGLAYPYDWRGFVGPKKKTIVGVLVFNPLWSPRQHDEALELHDGVTPLDDRSKNWNTRSRKFVTHNRDSKPKVAHCPMPNPGSQI
jgi:hypothetical protein